MLIPTIEEVIAQDIEALRKCPGALNCAACEEDICVMIASVAEFPSEYGRFRIVGFVNNKDGKDHIAIVKGEIGDGEAVLTRVHSACLTGDALGSMRCDCGPQLHEALRLIEAEGRGVVPYHQEEGRGIGLVNKLRAYALQDRGYDTLEANVALGFKPDEREYRIPAAMLRKLGVRSLRLMTNNPEKVEAMEVEGLAVVERV
jgi:3,4-dihydroxy 2-butanone 4-phosphate synthase / GTP cyclohydrolase II